MLSTDTVTGSGVAYKTAEAAVFPGFDGISHNDPALLQGPCAILRTVLRIWTGFFIGSKSDFLKIFSKTTCLLSSKWSKW